MREDTAASRRCRAQSKMSCTNTEKSVLVVFLILGCLAQANSNEFSEKSDEARDPSDSGERSAESAIPASADTIPKSQRFMDGASYPSSAYEPSESKKNEPESSVEVPSRYRSVEEQQRFSTKETNQRYFAQESQQPYTSIETQSPFPMEESRHPYVKKELNPYNPILPAYPKSEQVKPNSRPYYAQAQSKPDNTTEEGDVTAYIPMLLGFITNDDSDKPLQKPPGISYRPETAPPKEFNKQPLESYPRPKPIYQKTHFLKNVTKPRYIAYPQVQFKSNQPLTHDGKPYPTRNVNERPSYSVVHRSKPPVIENQEVTTHNPTNAKPWEEVPKTADERPTYSVVHRSRPPGTENPTNSKYESSSTKPSDEAQSDAFKATHDTLINRETTNPEFKPMQYNRDSPYSSQDSKSKGYANPSHKPYQVNSDYEADVAASHYSNSNEKNKDYTTTRYKSPEVNPESIPDIIIYDDVSKTLRYRSPPFRRPESTKPTSVLKERDLIPIRSQSPLPASYKPRTQSAHYDSPLRKPSNGNRHYKPAADYHSDPERSPYDSPSRKPDSGNRNYHSDPEYYSKPETPHSPIHYESYPSQDRPSVSRKPHRHRQPKEDDDYDDADGSESVPGIPGKDYPTFHTVPDTSFTCHGRSAGFYADPDTHCQVWHYCDLDGRRDSFLCSNGTTYSQEARVCDWWFNVDCSAASSFYSVNDDLYIVPRPTYSRDYESSESVYRSNPYSRHASEVRGRRTRHGYTRSRS